MKITVVNESEKHRASRNPELARDAEVLLKKIWRYFLKKRVRNSKLLLNKNELTVVFLSSAQMKKINYQFRGKNKATDILSFASSDPASLGELLLCIDMLKRQAIEQGHSLTHELSYMLVHGVLHLLGYDHELSQTEEKLMFRLQDRCFAVIGLG